MKDELIKHFITDPLNPNNLKTSPRITHSHGFILYVLTQLENEDVNFYQQTFQQCVDAVDKKANNRRHTIKILTQNVATKTSAMYSPLYINNFLQKLEAYEFIQYGDYDDHKKRKRIYKLVEKQLNLDFSTTQKLKKEFDKFSPKENISNPSIFNVSINNSKLLYKHEVYNDGVCLGLSILWLISHLNLDLPLLYTASNSKQNVFTENKPFNQQYFFTACAQLRASFENNSDTVFEKNKNQFYGFLKALKILHTIGTRCGNSGISGVFSLEYPDSPDESYRELFDLIREHKEMSLLTFTQVHAMAIYVKREEEFDQYHNFANQRSQNPFRKEYYQFIFYDPNRKLGAAPPLRLDLSRNTIDLQRELIQWLRYCDVKYQDHYGKNFFTEDFLKTPIISVNILSADNLKFLANFLFPASDFGPHKTPFFSKDDSNLNLSSSLAPYRHRVLGLPQQSLKTGDRGYDEEQKRISNILSFVLCDLCLRGVYSMVDKIIKKYNPFVAYNISVISCIQAAMHEGNVDIVRLLINQKNIKIDINNTSFISSSNPSVITHFPLFAFAAKYGYVDIVTLFLNMGVDPNINTRLETTPLFWAILYNQTATVILLLENDNINPNITPQINGQRILSSIRERKQEHLFEDFLSQSPKLQEPPQFFSLLRIAAELGNLSIIIAFFNHPLIVPSNEDLNYISKYFTVTEFSKIKNTKFFIEKEQSALRAVWKNQLQSLHTCLSENVKNYLCTNHFLERALTSHGGSGIARNELFLKNLSVIFEPLSANELDRNQEKQILEKITRDFIREIIAYVGKENGINASYAEFSGEINVNDKSGLTFIIEALYRFLSIHKTETLLSEQLQLFFRCFNYPVKSPLKNGYPDGQASREMIKRALQKMTPPCDGKVWQPYPQSNE